MRIFRPCFIFFFSLLSIHALGQQISAPDPQAGNVIGTVTDVNDDTIPGASVEVDGPISNDQHVAVANENGFFMVNGLRPAISYHVKVSAKGFAVWTSSEIILKPGQEFDLAGIKLAIATVETTVSAISSEQLALEQVKAEEKQRVLGVIPNFYVAYESNAAPLTTKLKFQLATRTATDVVSIGAAAFLAGVNQAAGTPDYVQGAKGYGQRFGASYADGVSDILIGGALLPSLLHQDPRYFYQGTGTNKSRFRHAILSPFICKGDNGRWQFNYSSIGGDLASGSLSNLYYPESNRGPGLVFSNALIITGGRMANDLAQEFILRRFTSNIKN
jgi:carboxypeptidase family protein